MGKPSFLHLLRQQNKFAATKKWNIDGLNVSTGGIELLGIVVNSRKEWLLR
jgi:hypothetical protein